MNVQFNVLAVVRRGLVGPPKDFQGGPDACVHLTSKPVLSKCSNLHKRSTNVTGRATGRATGRGTGRATGRHSWSAATFSHICFPSGSERSGFECHAVFSLQTGQHFHGLVFTRFLTVVWDA